MNQAQLATVSTPTFDDPILTTEQVAKEINVTKPFLEQLRSDGGGPEFIKVARLVRYRRSAIERWLSENTVASTAQANGLKRHRRHRAASARR